MPASPNAVHRLDACVEAIGTTGDPPTRLSRLPIRMGPGCSILRCRQTERYSYERDNESNSWTKHARCGMIDRCLHSEELFRGGGAATLQTPYASGPVKERSSPWGHQCRLSLQILLRCLDRGFWQFVGGYHSEQGLRSGCGEG